MAGASVAQAQGFKKWGINEADFFDFAQARRYWAELRTREQLEEAWNACESGPYKAWERQFQQLRMAVAETEQFKADPNAEAIKACYDLQQTYYFYEAFVGNGWRPPAWWSQEKRDRWYAKCAEGNIFAHSCDDLPDWK